MLADIGKTKPSFFAKKQDSLFMKEDLVFDRWRGVEVDRSVFNGELFFVQHNTTSVFDGHQHRVEPFFFPKKPLAVFFQELLYVVQLHRLQSGGVFCVRILFIVFCVLLFVLSTLSSA